MGYSVVMIGRFMSAALFTSFLLSFGSMTPDALAASQVVRGTLSSVTACTSPSGYVLAFANVTEKYVFKTGTTPVVPRGAVPVVGKEVFLTLGATTTCSTGAGLSAAIATGRLVTYFSTTADISPPPPPTTGNRGGSSGNDFLNRIQSILNSIFGGSPPPPPTTGTGGGTGGIPAGAGGGGSTGGGTSSASPFPFGGLIPVVVICDPLQSLPTGTILQATVVGPLGGLFNYGPYTKNHQCGPPAPGKNIVGSSMPGAICDICPGPEAYCPVPGKGWMDVLPGIGTSGCATPPKDCTPASVPAAKGNICKNPQYDQYIKDALRRCGGNMMNGTVPGIEQYCPNYANLNQQQREGFWVRFVDALMIKESGCRANTAAQEVTGEWSEGLLQLSCGNSAIGHPGACSAINQRCGNEFITGDPNNDANREASGRPILDPKNNIDCGVCIMDGLSGNGITNNKTGIDRYWGPLRTGRSTQPQIMAEARAFPGCTGPAGAGPAAPAPVSADCGTAPQAPIPGSCKQSGAQITDYASKVKVELAVRQGLRDCSNNTIVVTDTRGTSVPCQVGQNGVTGRCTDCLLYTSPSPRD